MAYCCGVGISLPSQIHSQYNSIASSTTAERLKLSSPRCCASYLRAAIFSEVLRSTWSLTDAYCVDELNSLESDLGLNFDFLEGNDFKDQASIVCSIFYGLPTLTEERTNLESQQYPYDNNPTS